MAIKMRRGKLKDFDPEKMTPSEIAITNETDVEKQKVFACFVPGAVKQMATYEDMERNVESALSEASQSILEGITKDINSSIDAANTAAENAQDAADNASQALNNANAATENANKAAELANDAYIDYQNNTAATAEKLSGEHRIDGAKFQGDVDVHHYGVCNSAAAVQVKQVDIPHINMSYGTRIDVKFTHGNTADSPKLQLNTWPAHPITYKGNPIPANYIMEKSLLTFEYDLGDKWHVVGDLAQAQLDELNAMIWKELDANDFNYSEYNNELWSYNGPDNIAKASCEGHSCSYFKLDAGHTYKIVCDTPQNAENTMQFALIEVYENSNEPYSAKSSLMQGGSRIIKCDSSSYYLMNSTLKSGAKIYMRNF